MIHVVCFYIGNNEFLLPFHFRCEEQGRTKVKTSWYGPMTLSTLSYQRGSIKNGHGEKIGMYSCILGLHHDAAQVFAQCQMSNMKQGKTSKLHVQCEHFESIDKD